MKKMIVAVGVAVLMAGCTTHRVATEDATFVPDDQIWNRDFLVEGENTGKVTIKRDSGILGSALSGRIYVDGVEIADLNPSEKIVLYLPVGMRVIGLGFKTLTGEALKAISANEWWNSAPASARRVNTVSVMRSCSAARTAASILPAVFSSTKYQCPALMPRNPGMRAAMTAF
ncbi:MAG: hypothetical protein LBB76_04500 [Azoarcus sp.]|nr:hypothetical protein [Azoarcus sp.]